MSALDASILRAVSQVMQKVRIAATLVTRAEAFDPTIGSFTPLGVPVPTSIYVTPLSPAKDTDFDYVEGSASITYVDGTVNLKIGSELLIKGRTWKVVGLRELYQYDTGKVAARKVFLA